MSTPSEQLREAVQKVLATYGVPLDLSGFNNAPPTLTDALLTAVQPTLDRLERELAEAKKDNELLVASNQERFDCIATLRADKERLDWLEAHRPWVHNQCNDFNGGPYWGLAPRNSPTIYGDTMRAALSASAARKETP